MDVGGCQKSASWQQGGSTPPKATNIWVSPQLVGVSLSVDISSGCEDGFKKKVGFAFGSMNVNDADY